MSRTEGACTCLRMVVDLLKQGSEYNALAQGYHKKGELEGAQINYKLAALCLHNAKQGSIQL